MSKLEHEVLCTSGNTISETLWHEHSM